MKKIISKLKYLLILNFLTTKICHATQETHLCVFIPATNRSAKDLEMLPVVADTWAHPQLQNEANAEVFVVSLDDKITDKLPVLVIDKDVEVPYKKLPLRTFAMWEFLGTNEAFNRRCNWYLKADPDSYINLRAVSQRLACFPPFFPQYLGAVHSTFTPNEEDNWLPRVWFGHGGSGYVISQALIHDVGASAGDCYDYHKRATGGVGMEDVLFALCVGHMMQHSSHEAYNFGWQKSEYVLDFHLTGYLWLRTRTLDPCYLVVHPVEKVFEMYAVHEALTQDKRNCFYTMHQLADMSSQTMQSNTGTVSYQINRQTHMMEKTNAPKLIWQPWQLSYLWECTRKEPVFESTDLQANFDFAEKCSWSASMLNHGCQGMSKLYGPETKEQCQESCCDDPRCKMWMFNEKSKCWIHSIKLCYRAPTGELWHGAIKRGSVWHPNAHSQIQVFHNEHLTCGSYLASHTMPKNQIQASNNTIGVNFCKMKCGRGCRCAEVLDGHCNLYSWPRDP